MKGINCEDKKLFIVLIAVSITFLTIGMVFSTASAVFFTREGSVVTLLSGILAFKRLSFNKTLSPLFMYLLRLPKGCNNESISMELYVEF